MADLHWTEELREKAEKVGRGKWTSSEYLDKESGTEAAVWGPDGDSIALVYTNLGTGLFAEDAAAYIAAASPENILKLLEELHEVSTEADPAGTLRELRLAQDTVKAQEVLIQELRAEMDLVQGQLQRALRIIIKEFNIDQKEVEAEVAKMKEEGQ